MKLIRTKYAQKKIKDTRISCDLAIKPMSTEARRIIVSLTINRV